MPAKEYGSANDVVPLLMEAAFKTRCEAALNALNLQATATAIPILGSSPAEGGRSTYISRLRSFVKFLLNTTSQHDESLLLFYPHTPQGSVTVEVEAATAFLHWRFTSVNKDVKDMHVSFICLFILHKYLKYFLTCKMLCHVSICRVPPSFSMMEMS